MVEGSSPLAFNLVLIASLVLLAWAAWWQRSLTLDPRLFLLGIGIISFVGGFSIGYLLLPT
jgi:hypothetical protein